MRKFLSRVFVLAGMLAMAACGGGGDSSFETPGTPGGGGGNNGPTVASVTLSSSTATILADGSTAGECPSPTVYATSPPRPSPLDSHLAT